MRGKYIPPCYIEKRSYAYILKGISQGRWIREWIIDLFPSKEEAERGLIKYINDNHCYEDYRDNLDYQGTEEEFIQYCCEYQPGGEIKDRSLLKEIRERAFFNNEIDKEVKKYTSNSKGMELLEIIELIEEHNPSFFETLRDELAAQNFDNPDPSL